MMLFKDTKPDEKLDKICQDGDIHTSIYMYGYQREVQMALVVIAVLMIPVMLLGKPITTLLNRRGRGRQNYTSIEEESDPDKKEESFGDIMIIQGKLSNVKIEKYHLE